MIQLNISNVAVLKNPNIKEMKATLIVVYNHICRYNYIALTSHVSSCSMITFHNYLIQ